MLAVFAKSLYKNKEEVKKNNTLKSKLYSPLNLNSKNKITGLTDVDNLGLNNINNNKNSLFLSVLNLNLQGIKLYDELYTKIANKPGNLKTRVLNKNLINTIQSFPSTTAPQLGVNGKGSQVMVLDPKGQNATSPTSCTGIGELPQSLPARVLGLVEQKSTAITETNENINKKMKNSEIEIPKRNISNINTTTKIDNAKLLFSSVLNVDNAKKIENYIYNLKKEFMNKDINLKTSTIQTDQKVNLLFSNNLLLLLHM